MLFERPSSIYEFYPLTSLLYRESLASRTESPPAPDDPATAHTKTATLLGAGTSELVRGLRQFLSCYRFWFTLSLFLSRDSEVPVDEPKESDKGQGYDAQMEMVLCRGR